jgi:hypothetical protein
MDMRNADEVAYRAVLRQQQISRSASCVQVRVMFGHKPAFMRVLVSDAARQVLLARLERINFWLWKGAPASALQPTAALCSVEERSDVCEQYVAACQEPRLPDE